MTYPLFYFKLILVAAWCGAPIPARDTGPFELGRSKGDVQRCREASLKCLELNDERTQGLCFRAVRFD